MAQDRKEQGETMKSKHRDYPDGEAPVHLSFYQDEALALCVEAYGVCPFGCVKDGAPNCNYNVRELLCEPARVTYLGADPKQAKRGDAWWNFLHQPGGIRR